MKTLNPLNSILIEIKRGGKSYYFFLDAGFPYSFSADEIGPLSNNDFNVEQTFELPLRSTFPVNLNNLSELMGVKLSGFLGMDFFRKFDNILIDIKSKSIEFNVSGFTPDYETEFIEMSPSFIINASMGEANMERCLVDTGAFMNVSSDNYLSGNGVSSGWQFPSAMGPLNLSYYNDIDIFIGNKSLGGYVCGNNMKSFFPFSHILGNNFMADFQCMFDVKNRKFKLKQSVKAQLINSNPSHTLGFQVILRNKQIIVSNKIDSCVEGINEGDIIDVPGFDMEDKEIINQIYNKLIFINSGKETEFLLNGKKVRCKPIKMFS